MTLGGNRPPGYDVLLFSISCAGSLICPVVKFAKFIKFAKYRDRFFFFFFGGGVTVLSINMPKREQAHVCVEDGM